jgi:hypothetical protein
MISVHLSNSAFFDVDSLLPTVVELQYRKRPHSPLKEDVTMISVSSLACGFNTITNFLYRRCLVAATFDAVP